ncbi:hypothetical protein [Lacipirellula sp.]|uniref:hypothetical protein n=1 Tax=Lacipirellula sp. TaxID=2691419 RepID=UPI003D146426
MQPDLKTRRGALQDAERKFTAEVFRLEFELKAARERRASAAAQLEMIEDLIREQEQAANPAGVKRSAIPPGLAVLRTVKENPGITTSEVVQRLLGRTATKAANEKHMLRTTLSNLVKAGRLARRSGMRHYLAEED